MVWVPAGFQRGESGGGFRFELDFEPVAKKNRRQISGRGRFVKDGRVRRDEKRIQAALLERGLRPGRPLFADQEVAVRIERLVYARRMIVEVESLGRPMPPRSSRHRLPAGQERDTSNMGELILDAMEGFVFDNDRQVRTLELTRVYDW